MKSFARVFLPAAMILLAGCRETSHPEAGRPNIILIMTDDQGYGDLGVTGNPVIRTPHLDRLAGGSARMESFYVSPVCAPTRASLMTGRYNYRTRVVDTWLGRAMLDPEEETLAEILNKAGYATGIFGKWHLGDNYPMRPQDQGFEEVWVHRGGGIGQPSDPPGGEGKYTDAVLFHNGQPIQTKGYCTDVYFESALEWIARSHSAGRPFFAYLPTNTPHFPFNDVPRRLYEYYRAQDVSPSQFPQLEGHPLPREWDSDRLNRIFAMITNIDENVGRLVDKLQELDLTDNTIIVFMVDNGPNTRRYVAGMRGMKSEVYEGGIRSPFWVRWPARLTPGSSDRIAAHIDVMPTLLEAAGVPLPRGLPIDGRSLLPLLEGEVLDWPDRTIVIQSHRGNLPQRYHNFAARTQRWKLLNASGFHAETLPSSPGFELYDMQEDPLEEQDLAGRRPEILLQMKAAYDSWFDSVSSSRPDNYAPPRIHIGTPYENPTVLTRQDWRSNPDFPAGWQRDSCGHWNVYVSRAAVYDFLLRFDPGPEPGSARLRIGDTERVQQLGAGTATCTFSGVELLQGETDIEAVLQHGRKQRGVHQLEVHQK